MSSYDKIQAQDWNIGSARIWKTKPNFLCTKSQIDWFASDPEEVAKILWFANVNRLFFSDN